MHTSGLALSLHSGMQNEQCLIPVEQENWTPLFVANGNRNVSSFPGIFLSPYLYMYVPLHTHTCELLFSQRLNGVEN